MLMVWSETDIEFNKNFILIYFHVLQHVEFKEFFSSCLHLKDELDEEDVFHLFLIPFLVVLVACAALI